MVAWQKVNIINWKQAVTVQTVLKSSSTYAIQFFQHPLNAETAMLGEIITLKYCNDSNETTNFFRIISMKVFELCGTWNQETEWKIPTQN